mmetsp:Transcript_10049/g.28577  ORF Transcript_10049/g.28577 Transcript_10049/m.28577 type:complete len:392 (-) Transcript_10049:115-1290(-)
MRVDTAYTLACFLSLPAGAASLVNPFGNSFAQHGKPRLKQTPRSSVFVLSRSVQQPDAESTEHHERGPNGSADASQTIPLPSISKQGADDFNENDDDGDGNDEALMQRNLRFAGVGRLYTGKEDYADSKNNNDATPHLNIVDRLSSSTVLVIGLGGVGSWAAEALCRSAIGSLVLVDLDDICISNTNRQLHATSSTVGKMKIDEMKRRLHDINPACNVTLIHDFISDENIGDILDSIPDITASLDAIDNAEAKAALISACVDRKIPVLTCGGSAGRTDPTKITHGDLTRVSGDRLLASCRRVLRKTHGFADGVKFREMAAKRCKPPTKWRVEAIYSTEPSKVVPDDGTSSFRRCDGALGTACFVTGSFGFIAASRIIEMIVSEKLLIPRKR